MPDDTRSPGLLLPLAFLMAFVVGYAVNFGVPWLAVGVDGGTTEWLLAHELDAALPREASTPHLWVLSGLVVGTALSLAWLVATIAAPPRLWTRAAETIAIALQGIALTFVTAGAAMGVGLAFRAGTGDTRWAASIAGWIVLVAAATGIVVVARLLLARLPTRRLPVHLLAGALVAIALLHVVPWMTTFYEGSLDRDPQTLLRVDVYGRSDPLILLSAGLLTLAMLAVAWIAAIAATPSHPRADPLVDGGFALLTLVPITLATVSIGRMLGRGTSALFNTGDQRIGIAWNAILFATLLCLALFLVGRALARTTREVEGAWSA